MSFDAFLRLLRDTYDKPQEVARWIMGLRFPLGQAWLMLGLVAVITTFMAMGASGLGALMAPATDTGLASVEGLGPQPDPMLSLMNSPFAMALLQFGGMALGAMAIHRVGRLFGGQGSWDQTLPLVAWLQTVFMVLQALQLLIVLALPFLALPVILFTVFSVFFLTAQFIMALHGFTSIGKVLGGMILTLLVLSFGLSILFLMIVR